MFFWTKKVFPAKRSTFAYSMSYRVGKLWHLAIIWAIRKAFQCILQGVRFLLANHTRLSPTSENESYLERLHWNANCAQVATRFIPAGAVLLVEKPGAARLKPKFTSTHCYLCMRRWEGASGECGWISYRTVMVLIDISFCCGCQLLPRLVRENCDNDKMSKLHIHYYHQDNQA